MMLETSETLATWAFDQPPDAAQEISAEALPDHRLDYLDYEGPVSGGRGSVTRWDSGECRLEQRSDTELTASLHGARLVGRITLARLPDTRDRWRFTYAPTI